MAGNESAASAGLGVTINTSAPTVTLEKDHDDLVVRDADTVIITATFSEAMTSAPTITIGTVVLGEVMTGAGTTWTYFWNVPAGNDGAAVATVAGMDLAGNPYAGTTNLAFVIDNTFPTASITSPTADEVVKDAFGLSVEQGFSVLYG